MRAGVGDAPYVDFPRRDGGSMQVESRAGAWERLWRHWSGRGTISERTTGGFDIVDMPYLRSRDEVGYDESVLPLLRARLDGEAYRLAWSDSRIGWPPEQS